MLEKLVQSLERATPETASMLYDEMHQHPGRDRHTSSLGEKAKRWFTGAAAATAIGTASVGAAYPAMAQQQAVAPQGQEQQLPIEQRIAELEREVEVNPTADVLTRLAEAHFDRGDLEQGYRATRKAQEKDPHHPWVYTNLGYYHIQKGNPQEAVSLLEEGVRRYPQVAHLRTNLAAAYAANKNFEPAISHATVSINLDPGLLEAYNARGVSYLFKGMIQLKQENNPRQANEYFELAAKDLHHFIKHADRSNPVWQEASQFFNYMKQHRLGGAQSLG